MFDELVGKQVKIPYKDGTKVKVAWGTLEQHNGDFVRVSGRLGTLILHVRNIISLQLQE